MRWGGGGGRGARGGFVYWNLGLWRRIPQVANVAVEMEDESKGAKKKSSLLAASFFRLAAMRIIVTIVLIGRRSLCLKIDHSFSFLKQSGFGQAAEGCLRVPEGPRSAPESVWT